MILFTDTPMRRVVSMSFEMALMASPGLVRYTIQRRPSTRKRVTAGTTMARGRMRISPNFMTFTSQSGLITGRGRPVKITMLRFWIKKERRWR
jgi:hypothetical protein